MRFRTSQQSLLFSILPFIDRFRRVLALGAENDRFRWREAHAQVSSSYRQAETTRTEPISHRIIASTNLAVSLIVIFLLRTRNTAEAQSKKKSPFIPIEAMKTGSF
jgi:hypothetical protein